MPAYNTNSQVAVFSWSQATPPILDENVAGVAFNAETVANGTASQQFCLPRHKFPKSISAEIAFSADPGTFEIDIQTADEDDSPNGTNYVSHTTVTSGLNASHKTRVELTDVTANWIRALMVSTTNPVQLTVKFFRHY